MNINGFYGNMQPSYGGFGYGQPPQSFGQLFSSLSNMAYPQPPVIGGGANSWGPVPYFPAPNFPVSNFPPTINNYSHNSAEPVGDLYSWDPKGDDTKTEEPKKRRHRDKPEKETPEKHVYTEAKGRVWGDPHFEGADGEKYDVQGKAGKTYNLLSDDKVQINAKFASFNGSATSNIMSELGFRINGDKIKVAFANNNADAEKIVEINGTRQNMSADWTKNGVSWDASAKKLSVAAESTDGESWKFVVDFKRSSNTNYLDIGITGKDIGNNNTNTAGLWGHSLNNDDSGDRAGGGGVILGPDGKPISKSAKEGDAEHNAALALYVEDDLFSTGSRWNAY